MTTAADSDATARVELLTDTERSIIIEALGNEETKAADVLAVRLEIGEEYANELDELVRLTIRKRALEAELNRVKQRIGNEDEGLTAAVLADWMARGSAGEKHAATGRTCFINHQIWARVPTQRGATDEEKAAAKARANAALREAGLGDFIDEGFNTSSLSGFFREEIKRARARGEVIADVGAWLAAHYPKLVGAIALTDDHVISVRS